MAFFPQSSLLPIAWIMILAHNAHASTANTTTDALVGWTAGPSTRGTLALLYSCIFTIFACTWTVLHLNVPGMEDSAMRRTRRKIKWMIINILFPEFILAKGICDLRLALDQLREFDEYIREEPEALQWTTSKINRYEEKYIEEWEWEVVYPKHWRFLCRLLNLELRPNLCSPRSQEDIESGPSSPTAGVSPAPSPSESMELHEFAADGLPALSVSKTHASGKVRLQSMSRDQSQVFQDNDEDATENNIPFNSLDQPEWIGQAQNRLEAAREPAEASGLNVAGDTEPTARGRQEASSHATASTDYDWLEKKRTRIQEWTIVHSYYAQMGGLIAWRAFSARPGQEDYFSTVTASKLTSRYKWTLDDCFCHPLKDLILSEEDINDKSKADWLIKGIAVLQIIWLVLNVITRGITGLPVTQLEIATVAFATMAIFTYLANWWKPKDISQVTIVRTSSYGSSLDEDPSQQLSERLWPPWDAAYRSRDIYDNYRIPNDSVWMEGDAPLILILMGVSSMIFGGLHCLAWNFEFPTQTQRNCWRAASIISTVLPGIVLCLNLFLNYISNIMGSWSIDDILPMLEPLDRLPEELWREITQRPKFLSWAPDAQKALLLMPPGCRNWDDEPSARVVEKSQQAAKWTDLSRVKESMVAMLQIYTTYHFGRKREFENYPAKHREPGSNLFLCLRRIRHSFYSKELQDLCTDYEAFVASKYAIPEADLFHGTIIGHMMWAYERLVAEGEDSMWPLQRTNIFATNILTVVGGVFYALARIAIIVLVFTCLRATPEGVYQNTPWTRFLPHI
ncbi:hypothetical protein N0V93_008760 [Gnomoniopsis smithogilvyi]|uniref:Uncharacterized protein n=1 Tax=Gnomoniopsis smithogilvyi TaxID=1191159 RepID=A0A9W8YNM9_9PEZI|nr:hypothetical protein N0V93_008760 [Gnomoniopsis smithogilvyi]